MNIEVKDLITLSDKNEYVVVSIVNCDNQNYYYIADVNNPENLKFCYIVNDEVVVVKDIELLEKIIPLFAKDMNFD